MAPLLALLVAVALAGNLLALSRALPGPAGALLPWAGLPLALALLAWARADGRTAWRDVGLGWQGLAPAVGVGVAVGLAVVAAAAMVLSFPPLLGEPVSYAGASAVPLGTFLWRVLVTMPLDTVLVEEVVFRGVLLAALMRRWLPAPAVALDSLAFTLWHPAIILATLGQTNLAQSPLFTILGVAAAHLVVLAAGVLFCLLRLATGHLAAPMAAHWVANAGILLVLRAVGEATPA